MTPDKTRETRLRRLAARQGLRLQKSPRRDPNAWDFGTYQLVDDRGGWVVLANHQIGHGYGMSLDDIEEWLNGGVIHMYKITALMKARPYPPVTEEQRQRFTEAIHHLHSNVVMQPSVTWDEPGQAQVTLACGGEDASSAAGRAKSIIDGNAAKVAHIYVREVEVINAEALESAVWG